MSVLVFVELADGLIKKSSLEAVSYGAAMASNSNEVTALVLGTVAKEQLEEVGKSGAGKVLTVSDKRLDQPIASAYAASSLLKTSPLFLKTVGRMPKRSIVMASCILTCSMNSFLA